MFNPARFSSDIVSWVIECVFHWRYIVKDEAAALMERQGPSALDTARQVAQLARARRDWRSARLWDAVSREIERRQAV
ncbi:hypothetical protein ACWIGM_01435 [Bosea sp. NPDC055332]